MRIFPSSVNQIDLRINQFREGSENDRTIHIRTIFASSMLPKDSTVKEHFTTVGLPLSKEKKQKQNLIIQCILHY